MRETVDNYHTNTKTDVKNSHLLRDCDVIQEKTDELTDLVKGLHSRLDAQKQAKIDALQDKVKEYEKEMDRLRDLIGK